MDIFVAVDTIIVALFFYSLLVLFKRSKTFFIFIGVAIVVVLYLLADLFNLFLTLRVLQYFVGISAILFVIVFQTEIRKYFEFLGLISSRRIKVGPLASKSPSISEIIQSCVQMAQNKIGALIIIQGRENIDNYVKGGVNLDGLISEDIILSVFYPGSEGHDGALLIHNNRISRFGCQLPLSNNFKEIGKHGTRHSAALGISEISDALAIVVSEEKGQISVARDGRLKLLEEFSDLEKELTKYINSKFPQSENHYTYNFLKKNWLLKIIALLLAISVRFISTLPLIHLI